MEQRALDVGLGEMATGNPASTASQAADAPLFLGKGSADGGAWDALVRPSDEDILLQENAIRDAEAEKQDFVGTREPLSALLAEYENGSKIFQTRIKRLGNDYVAIRRTRGDGNCFYRGLIFAYLEYLVESGDELEVQRVIRRIEGSKAKLEAQGFIGFTFEEMLNVLVEMLSSIQSPNPRQRMDVPTLEIKFRHADVSNYIVMFLRFLTSCEIQRRADFFEPFITGLTGHSVTSFCHASVEVMGEESDHIQITALTDALGVPVRVVYLDGAQAPGYEETDVSHIDFEPSGEGGDVDARSSTMKPGQITLLYRPGHYDCIYSSK